MEQEKIIDSQNEKIQRFLWRKKWWEWIVGGMIVLCVFVVFAFIPQVMRFSPKPDDYYYHEKIAGRKIMTDAEKTGRIYFSIGSGVVAFIGAGIIAFGAVKFYRFPGAEKFEEERARKEKTKAEREQKRKEKAEKAQAEKLAREKAKATKKLEKEMAKAEEIKKPKWSLKNLFGGKKKVEAVVTEVAAPETPETKAEEVQPPEVAPPSDTFFDKEIRKQKEGDKKTSPQKPQQPKLEKPDDEPLQLKPLDE